MLNWNRFSNPLVTSTNSRKAERAVREAAESRFVGDLDIFYEHGQWWVMDSTRDFVCTYSAVDTSRGIDFELIDCNES